MPLHRTFNPRYFILAVSIFLIEVLIALYVRDRIVRPYVGDVLVVIMIYCFIRSYFNVPILKVALIVLAFAFTIEILQYVRIVHVLGLNKSKLARTVIGTQFEWIDVGAYVVGIGIVLIAERLLRGRRWLDS
jgi:hypothetical protein